MAVEKQIIMPTKSGIWKKEEVGGQHAFSYRLAEFMASFLPKNEPVFDFGCGLGTYSKYLRDVGFEKVWPVEGEDLEELFETKVTVADLAEPQDFGEQGNLICLEVAEHVPVEFMDALLDNIVRHCNNYLVLSWGVVGQQGHGHVNCIDNYEAIGMLRDKGFSLLWQESKKARSVIEPHYSWFNSTVLIFKKDA